MCSLLGIMQSAWKSNKKWKIKSQLPFTYYKVTSIAFISQKNTKPTNQPKTSPFFLLVCWLVGWLVFWGPRAAPFQRCNVVSSLLCWTLSRLASSGVCPPSPWMPWEGSTSSMEGWQSGLQVTHREGVSTGHILTHQLLLSKKSGSVSSNKYQVLQD